MFCIVCVIQSTSPHKCSIYTFALVHSSHFPHCTWKFHTSESGLHDDVRGQTRSTTNRSADSVSGVAVLLLQSPLSLMSPLQLLPLTYDIITLFSNLVNLCTQLAKPDSALPTAGMLRALSTMHEKPKRNNFPPKNKWLNISGCSWLNNTDARPGLRLLLLSAGSLMHAAADT